VFDIAIGHRWRARPRRLTQPSKPPSRLSGNGRTDSRTRPKKKGRKAPCRASEASQMALGSGQSAHLGKLGDVAATAVRYWERTLREGRSSLFVRTKKETARSDTGFGFAPTWTPSSLIWNEKQIPQSLEQRTKEAQLPIAEFIANITLTYIFGAYDPGCLWIHLFLTTRALYSRPAHKVAHGQTDSPPYTRHPCRVPCLQ
jgi:hypothetical protein